MFGGGGLGSLFESMGGMGGGGGGQRRGASMFDVDDDMMGGGTHFTSSGGGMPGGMPRPRPSRANSSSNFRGGQQRPPSPPTPTDITKPLKVSLGELYSGTTKHLKVGRRLLTGSTEDKVLEIQIHPGWKSGTKIRFPRAGNETPHGEAQDLVFVVEEKPNETYVREGNDLVCRVPISLVDALTGSANGEKAKKTVEMLDGRKVQVPVPLGIVKPGQETTIPGEGMPIRKEGSVKKKGDLIVKWDVVFPERLTPAQKEGLRKVLA